MSAIHLKLRVTFADGSAAPGLRVRVHENFGSDFDGGVTNGDGHAEKDLRERRQISVPDPRNPFGPTLEVDDPADQPTFQVTLTDSLPQSQTRRHDRSRKHRAHGVFRGQWQLQRRRAVRPGDCRADQQQRVVTAQPSRLRARPLPRDASAASRSESDRPCGAMALP